MTCLKMKLVKVIIKGLVLDFYEEKINRTKRFS